MTNPHIQETADTATERAKEMAERARKAASHKFDELRENMGEFYEEGLKRARRAEAGLEGYIRDNPLAAVLVAAGVGVGLGIVAASLIRRS